MRQLTAALSSKFKHLFKIIFSQNSQPNKNDIAKEEKLAVEEQKQIHNPGIINKNSPNLLLNYQQRSEKTRKLKKASLFPDGKTNKAALSLVLRGVAEILSQKMDLSWKGEKNSSLSYEKEIEGGKGKICYYITDNPETPHPETLAEEAALAVIDQFDPRAGAIHLIYCALVANLEKPWEGNFSIDDRQLLEYTGLIKRRDLCRHEQLTILYNLLRQPAQVLACIIWPKQGKIGAFRVADLKIWDISIFRDFDTDKAGKSKLTGLKVIGQPGVWAKYFLNKNEYYRHTGIITKKTVQKLFSIGKKNAGAARMLVWLSFKIEPESSDFVMGKTLMEIAYGVEKVAFAQSDRQLRRQMADDLETDLKVIQEAGWQVEIETPPPWLTGRDRTKRPIGYWSELLNTKWFFHLPTEVQESLTLPESQLKQNKIQPPSGNVIREARKAKGWSRSFLATTMGKSVSWVDAVETGHRQVSQKDLPKLVNTLELH